jgi:hypothetical protein
MNSKNKPGPEWHQEPGKSNVFKLSDYKPEHTRVRQCLHVWGEPLRRLEDWMAGVTVWWPGVRHEAGYLQLDGVGPRFEPLEIDGVEALMPMVALIGDADAPLNALIEFLRCGEVPPDIYADFLLRLEVTK